MGEKVYCWHCGHRLDGGMCRTDGCQAATLTARLAASEARVAELEGQHEDVVPKAWNAGFAHAKALVEAALDRARRGGE